MKTLNLMALTVVFAVKALFSPIDSFATSFADDFTGGLSPINWMVFSNSTRYKLDASHANVVLSGTNGGSSALRQRIEIIPAYTAFGDFDVRVDMTNAQINLTAGTANQIQLNAFLKTSGFYVVRDDENPNGQNAHVWDTSSHGAVTTNASFGTMRITRVGSLVSGYFNSILLYQHNYDTNPVSFSCALHNQGTSDAISVTFDNFSVTADKLVLTLNPIIAVVGKQKVSISWPSTGVSNILESCSSLSPANWQTVTNLPVITGNFYVVTNDTGGSSRYYRMHQP